MSNDNSWKLERLGTNRPMYFLQQHLPCIKVGRSAEGNDLRLAGVHISRKHFELRQRIESDERIYWSICDLGSSLKTYVNGNPIPPRSDIVLNDGDIISVGSNDTASSARQKISREETVFVYKLHAPKNWTEDVTLRNQRNVVGSEAPTPPPLETEDNFGFFRCIKQEVDPEVPVSKNTPNVHLMQRPQPRRKHSESRKATKKTPISSSDSDSETSVLKKRHVKLHSKSGASDQSEKTISSESVAAAQSMISFNVVDISNAQKRIRQKRPLSFIKDSRRRDLLQHILSSKLEIRRLKTKTADTKKIRHKTSTGARKRRLLSSSSSNDSPSLLDMDCKKPRSNQSPAQRDVAQEVGRLPSPSTKPRSVTTSLLEDELDSVPGSNQGVSNVESTSLSKLQVSSDEDCQEVEPVLNFSQTEEIIILNSDSEDEYLSQSWPQVKSERLDDDDHSLQKDREFENQMIDGIEVITLDDDDLEDSQLPLYTKLIGKIKQEIEPMPSCYAQFSQPRSPPPDIVRSDDDNDNEDDNKSEETTDGHVVASSNFDYSPLSSDSEEFYELPSPIDTEARDGSDESLDGDHRQPTVADQEAVQIKATEASPLPSENLSASDADEPVGEIPQSPQTGAASREIKVIEALPQPPRRSFMRSASSDAADKSKGKKSVLRQKNRPKTSSLTTPEILDLRRQKLKELALKNQGDKEKPVEMEKRASAKPKTAGIKVSEPKASKLTEFDFLPPQPRQPKSVPPAVQSGPRRVAETFEVEGGRAIKKLSFHNVISNVGSQSLPLPVDRVQPISYESITLTSADDTKRKKTITWRDSLPNKPLADVRYIPPEGRGGPISQRISDRREFPRNLQIGVKGSANDTSKIILPVAHVSPLRQGLDEKSHDFEDILCRIVAWKTQWLAEQERCSQEPPVEGPGLRVNHVPNVFVGLADYLKTFYPLLLHELWMSVFKDYLETKVRRYEFLGAVVRFEQHVRKNASFLSVYGLLPESEANENFPRDGWLLKVDLRTENGREIKPCFGFVESSKLQARGVQETPYDKTILDAIRNHESNRTNGSLLSHSFNLRLRLKHIDYHLDCKKPIKLMKISQIKPALRHVRAVDEAISSPLFYSILLPKDRTFYVGSGNESLTSLAPIKSLSTLNSDQKRIVLSCSQSCTTNMDQPRISLVQGPPGTGKSTTIAATIAQIYYRWKKTYGPDFPKPRILLVAPSNAAVDELFMKTSEVRKELSEEHQFKMMRIGIEELVHQNVKPYMFERLRENEMRRYWQTTVNSNSVAREIETRKTVLASIAKKMETTNDQSELHHLHREFKRERELLKRAEVAGPTQQETSAVRYSITEKLFANADVIATTLSSSMNFLMERHFVQNEVRKRRNKNFRAFSICIVDEASQCVEPEALIPFRLSFTKFIMVGDPEQLPATVTSKLAKEKSFGESMFKRLFKRFEICPNADTMILKLRIQYRMHNDIMAWPNHYFYGGFLQKGDQTREHHLCNYKVLDLRWTVEDQNGISFVNEKEADFVATLAKHIRGDLKRRGLLRQTVGILTFYARQRLVIFKKLEAMGLSEIIPVKTVDGFQGSECDIIIMSCVRAPSLVSGSRIGFVADEPRLNVALTRAKYCLFIAGNFETLKVNSMWRELYNDAEKRHRVSVVPKSFNFENVMRAIKAVQHH